MLTRRQSLALASAATLERMFSSIFPSAFAQDIQLLGIDNSFKYLSLDGTTQIVCFMDVDLLSGIVPGNLNLWLMADSVTLNGPLVRPSLSLTIICRVFNCGPNAQISTDGGPPEHDYTNQHAQSGGTPSANGSSGRTGSDGKNAGFVAILAREIVGNLKISAVGGPGGGAEGGGNGANGLPGIPWNYNLPAGGDGGPGGSAGAAGSPGKGGNGGAVTIATLDSSFSHVAADTRAGGPGAPGAHGTPGVGGPPGPGGEADKPVHCPSAHGPHHSPAGPCFQHVVGPPGHQGANPPAIPTPPPANVGGTAGNVISHADTIVSISQRINPEYVGVTLHAAEVDYLNGNLDSAIPRLVWVKALTEGRLTLPPDPGYETFKAERYRANALLNQIGLKLDYYGQCYNSVPLLQIDEYIALVENLLATGDYIEKSYNAYNAAIDQNIHDRQQLQLTINKTSSRNNELQLSLGLNKKSRDSIEADIGKLNDQFSSIWIQLFGAELRFKNAVRKQAGGCTFEQIVAVASMISSLATSGGNAASAVGPALLALRNLQEKDGQNVPVPDTMDGFKYKISQIKAVGSDVKDFVEAASQLQGVMSPADPVTGIPGLPKDDIKILATAEDIDKELQKYKDLPEARAYQELIDAFVAVSQARNNKIVELNALYIEYDSINSQIVKNNADILDLQNQISSVTDPRIARAKLFMEGAYRDVISAIRRCLYSIYRAYYYYSLDDAQFRINDTSIAALMSTKVTIIDKYTNTREVLAGHPSVGFHHDIHIAKYVTKHDWASFQRGKDLTFTIDTKDKDLNILAQVLVNKISLSFIGNVVPRQGFKVIFIHHGRSTMIDPGGREYVFSHIPVYIPFEVDAHGVTNEDGDFSGQFVNDGARAGLKGEQLKYNGVSPYGPWTVVLKEVDQEKRRNISDIVIHFGGVARARSRAPVHAR